MCAIRGYPPPLCVNAIHQASPLIPIDTTEAGEQVVLGRDLWKFLEVNSNYTTWFRRMTDYGFVAGQDYDSISGTVARQGRGTVERVDHILTLDMAKELSMIQRTEKGRQARLYFSGLSPRYQSSSP